MLLMVIENVIPFEVYNLLHNGKLLSITSLWMMKINDKLKCLLLVPLYLWQISQITNGNLCGCEWTPYDLIEYFNLCHVYHTHNDDRYGTEQNS